MTSLRNRGVGGVDEAGVGLAERDLADDALHVVLVRDDVVERRGQPEGLEYLARVVADGDALGGDDELRAGLQDVLELSIPAGLSVGR